MCVSAVVIVASSSLLSHFVVAASSHVAVIILSIAVTQRHLSLMPSPIPIPKNPPPDYLERLFRCCLCYLGAKENGSDEGGGKGALGARLTKRA